MSSQLGQDCLLPRFSAARIGDVDWSATDVRLADTRFWGVLPGRIADCCYYVSNHGSNHRAKGNKPEELAPPSIQLPNILCVAEIHVVDPLVLGSLGRALWRVKGDREQRAILSVKHCRRPIDVGVQSPHFHLVRRELEKISV